MKGSEKRLRVGTDQHLPVVKNSDALRKVLRLKTSCATSMHTHMLCVWFMTLNFTIMIISIQSGQYWKHFGTSYSIIISRYWLVNQEEIIGCCVWSLYQWEVTISVTKFAHKNMYGFSEKEKVVPRFKFWRHKVSVKEWFVTDVMIFCGMPLWSLLHVQCQR